MGGSQVSQVFSGHLSIGVATAQGSERKHCFYKPEGLSLNPALVLPSGVIRSTLLNLSESVPSVL